MSKQERYQEKQFSFRSDCGPTHLFCTSTDAFTAAAGFVRRGGSGSSRTFFSDRKCFGGCNRKSGDAVGNSNCNGLNYGCYSASGKSNGSTETGRSRLIS